MAHQFAIARVNSGVGFMTSEIAEDSWKYADTMQAGADKRNPKGLPDVLKVVDSPKLNNESILHDIDCYFDNANNTKRDADNLIQSIYEHLTGEVKTDVGITDVGEWQPDWSQAPDWANWWAMDIDSSQAHWYEVEPIADVISWRRQTRVCRTAPSFDYFGNHLQDSLRKRPNT